MGQVRALVGVVGCNHPYVPVVGGVGIGLGAIAGEGEELAVRRPRWIVVVVIAGRDLRHGFGGNVEDIEVGATAVKIADGVFLELQAVDHPRRLGFGLFRCRRLVGGVLFSLTGCGFELFGRRITEDQDEALAVGSPNEVVDVLNRVSKLLSFATEAVQKVDLGFAFVALRQEREEFAVGGPARMLRRIAFGGEGDGVAASGRHHVNPSFRLVVL